MLTYKLRAKTKSLHRDTTMLTVDARCTGKGPIIYSGTRPARR
jgi:hypothetical protein